MSEVPGENGTGFLREEIKEIRALRVIVDDKNKLALENLPMSNQPNNGCTYGEWGYSDSCYRYQKGAGNYDLKLNLQWAPQERRAYMDCGSYFLLMFPIDWLAEILLLRINAPLPEY